MYCRLSKFHRSTNRKYDAVPALRNPSNSSASAARPSTPPAEDDEVQLTGVSGTLKTPGPISPDVKPFPPGRSPPVPGTSSVRLDSGSHTFGSPRSARQRQASESSDRAIEPEADANAAESDEVQLVSESGLRGPEVKPFERSRADSGSGAGLDALTGEAQSPPPHTPSTSTNRDTRETAVSREQRESPASGAAKRSFNAVPPPLAQQRRPFPGAAGAARRPGIAGPCVHVEGAGITEAAVRSAFEQFGPISDLKIDRKNPKCVLVHVLLIFLCSLFTLKHHTESKL